MTVPAGTRLGPYEILSAIGAGGMGEVYKARDTRLDRSVAVKVLPADFAQNAQLRLRFEREAKTISQLNHPNICTLFDVGDGYLVMELLDGESLGDRIARGPLPIQDVLRFGGQIAEALDKAHRAGVVHRDLKPGNVMLTKSGAKLLDFGLAKGGGIEVTLDDATQHKPLTQEGTILGTFQYMSPEQLEGLDADGRSDIFSLGAVLHEMATGQRAFDGKTKTSLIAAIVREHPRPIAELQPLTPPALQHVVDKCLAKDPDERWQSAHDLAAELKWISGAGSQAGVAIPIATSRSRRRKEWIAAAVAGWAIAILAIVAAVLMRSRLQKADPLTQAEVTGAIASTADSAPLAVSPDGSRIVIVAPSGSAKPLSLRDLRSGTVKELPGTEGANYPFWSPDGQSIGFFANGKMKTISTESGAVQTTADAAEGRGGAWSPLGVIVFAPKPIGALWKVAENGGAAVAVTKTPQGSATDRDPVFLADGKRFLYVEGLTGGESIRAGSVDGGEARKVLDYASTMVLAGDWLLTVRDGNLLAQRFDQNTLAVAGKPLAIAQHIEWYGPKFNAAFGAGAGTLVYQRAAQPRQQFYYSDNETAAPIPTGEPGQFANSSLSPDGHLLIANRYDVGEGGSDLWMTEIGGSRNQRITHEKNGSMDLNFGVFSPDGQRIAVSIESNNGQSKGWLQPAGGGSQESLTLREQYAHITEWRSDDTLLVPAQGLMTTMRRGSTTVVVPSIIETLNAVSSPDGKFVAYDANEGGRSDVFVTHFPLDSAKWQISTAGGDRPFWSADGKKLYFRSNGQVMAAAVRVDGATFASDPPQPVRAFGDHIDEFAVSRSGRFVILRTLDPGKAPLSVVLNWQKLLDK